jgi:hypothetical protein
MGIVCRREELREAMKLTKQARREKKIPHDINARLKTGGSKDTQSPVIPIVSNFFRF